MAYTPPERRYGFLIETGKFADSPSVVARVLAKREDEDHPINPDSSRGENAAWGGAPKKADGLYLADLELRCYVGSDGKYFHGPDIRFDSVRFVDEELAAKLLRTMKRINREIAKTNAREPDDVLMAVGRAIGATLHIVPGGEPHRGSFYSDNEWRFGDLTEARDEFRRAITELKTKHLKPEPQAEETSGAV